MGVVAGGVLVGAGSCVGKGAAFSTGAGMVGVGGLGDGKGVFTLTGIGIRVALKDSRTPSASEQDSVTRQPIKKQEASNLERELCVIKNRSNHTTKEVKQSLERG